jgi:hypothetical protein
MIKQKQESLQPARFPILWLAGLVNWLPEKQMLNIQDLFKCTFSPKNPAGEVLS